MYDQLVKNIDTALIVLPQTTFKFWGIPNASQINFFQVNLPIRYGNDSLFAKSYYEINKKILEALGIHKLAKKESIDPKFVSNPQVLTDRQILNLSHHYFGAEKITKPSIVSYASDGYSSLLISDIKYLKHFSRGIIRSKRQNKIFSPRAIWHWDDYAKSRQKELLNLGWVHEFINSDLISFHAKKFLENSFDYLDEISDFNLSMPTVIIYPPVNSSTDQVRFLLEDLIRTNEEFRESYGESNQILIKQHKVCVSEHPAKFIFNSKEIRVAKSIKLRVLPVEILIFGFKKVTYVAPPTSTVFASSLRFEKILWGNKMKIPSPGYSGKLGYELMLKRHNMRF